MSSQGMPPKLFDGADWQTDRRTLAQLLYTLDGMQAFAYGMTTGGVMAGGTAVGFSPDDTMLDDADQLQVMAGLAQDALLEVDMLAADLAQAAVPARVRWLLVEARQLLCGIRALADEAREAMRFNTMESVPGGVVLEFGDALRRVKLLLAGVDEGAVLAAAG